VSWEEKPAYVDAPSVYPNSWANTVIVVTTATDAVARFLSSFVDTSSRDEESIDLSETVSLGPCCDDRECRRFEVGLWLGEEGENGKEILICSSPQSVLKWFPAVDKAALAFAGDNVSPSSSRLLTLSFIDVMLTLEALMPNAAPNEASNCFLCLCIIVLFRPTRLLVDLNVT
jgi:hypothetical protein